MNDNHNSNEHCCDTIEQHRKKKLINFPQKFIDKIIANSGHVKCFKYALAHDCEHDIKICILQAHKKGHHNIVEYLLGLDDTLINQLSFDEALDYSVGIRQLQSPMM